MEKTFSFGKNWQIFLKSLNDDRFKFAEKSLTEFMKSDLKGKSFIDIGCGSGLFSYTALNLGASRVVSFDIDPFSVQCCRYLYDKANKPNNWEISEGSILNKEFVSKFGEFDVVYSWGVLHHTGDMWEAIRNSANLVKYGGYYYIAIYNKRGGLNGSGFWLRVKKMYNYSPKIGKWFIEGIYMFSYLTAYTIKLKNPVSYVRNYHKNKRGMRFKTDVTDWLGGYPYQFATPEEIFNFMKKEFPDFELMNIKSTKGIGNNWFLFKKH